MEKPFTSDRAKEGKIIEMHYHGFTYDQIAKELHVAPNHISSVIKAERMRVIKEKRDAQNALALQLFSEGKSPLDICINLAISTDEALRMHNDYLELTSRGKLTEMHEELGEDLPNLISLYETMKNAGIPQEDIIELSKDYFTIPHARKNLGILLDEVRRQEDKREQFISDWMVLNNHNMDLERQNRYKREENRDLENKNRDLENKNRDLENKNRDLQRKGTLKTDSRKSRGSIGGLINISSPLSSLSDSKLDDENHIREYPVCDQKSYFGLLSPLPKILDNSYCPKEVRDPSVFCPVSVKDQTASKQCFISSTTSSIVKDPTETESHEIAGSD
jgi:hypothetical protein